MTDRRPMHAFTSIGRPLDFGWPTNVAVVIAAPILAVAAWGWAAFMDGGSAPDPISFGVVAGIGFFVGWAIGREVAPDRPASAFVAGGAVWLTLLTLPGAGLVVLVQTLILARVVNRAVGPPITLFDGLGVLGTTGFALVVTGNPLVVLPAVLALELDARLRDPNPGARIWSAATVLLTLWWTFVPDSLGGRLHLGPEFSWGVDPSLLLPAAVITIAFGREILRTPPPASVADATGIPLDVARVRGGMIVALIAAVATVPQGEAAAGLGGALWAALAGVAAANLAARIFRRRGRDS